ncbi:hypothetical protein JRQ81_003288, partial [Phrynocephalus forsythii]
MREVKDEGAELIYWERRKKEEYNPETEQYSPVLTERQKTEMQEMLNKYRTLFTPNARRAKGVK